MRRSGHRTIIACALALIAASCGDDAEREGEPLPADIDTLLTAASTAMGEVTSVRFHIERAGAPVFIDEFESIQLDELDGRFEAPASADAVLQVTVNGNLSTKLGAIAIDDEVYLSNPVTGTFEPLQSGYDLDPSKFFDPVNGWRPLLAELDDPELVGEEDRGGTRYHVRGTAPAERMDAITAGLVEQDLTIDFWLRRDTGLVSASEFTTSFEGDTTSWVLELEDFGEDFEIEQPDLDG
jgi:lipoprotein LprG